MNQKRLGKVLVQALKIAIGSSMAIYLAERLHLENAVSAGSIALLTLVTTKWETIRLSFARLITFGIAVLLACLVFSGGEENWGLYGIYVFFVVIISEALDWRATISVNAVIGTHLLTERNFTPAFIRNEMMLVLIGISMAVILNLFYDYRGRKSEIVRNMRHTEEELKRILGDLAAYLSHEPMRQDVWKEIGTLEKELEEYLADAVEYQDDTFQSHPGYYINYFEMRMKQLGVLHNLHSETKRIRTVPRQAEVIAGYIRYLMDYVIEINFPMEQMEELQKIFDGMKTEPLPVTREEFENRALLYHILMDLEEFLLYKKEFVESLDERQRKLYWKEGGAE